jgi:hypothetical protein
MLATAVRQSRSNLRSDVYAVLVYVEPLADCSYGLPHRCKAMSRGERIRLHPYIRPRSEPIGGGASQSFLGHLYPQVWCGFKYLWTDSAEMTVRTGAIIGRLNILVGLGRGNLLGPAYAFQNLLFLQAA